MKSPKPATPADPRSEPTRDEVMAELAARFGGQAPADDEFTIDMYRAKFPDLGKDKVYAIIKAGIENDYLAAPEWRMVDGRRVKAWRRKA